MSEYQQENKVNTDLFEKLTPEARELYKYVNSYYPPYIFAFFGGTPDDAFRNLLKAVHDDTVKPRRWDRLWWSDTEVAQFSDDLEVRNRAWDLLASHDSKSWATRWTSYNREMRNGAYVVLGVFVVAVLIVLWPIL